MTAEEHDQTKKAPAPRFVEELADKNDAWISLTDAARITRTSEPMVRRWVATGRLPTKQEPVGINQRTRLVRLSDVGRLRPIIDPTAAITDEIHKLDLLSIPRQQAQIVHAHQHLLELVQEMRQEIEAQIHHTRQSFEKDMAILLKQMQDWDNRFSSLQRQQETLAERIASQRQEFEHSRIERKQQVERQQQDLEQLRATMKEQFQTILTTQQEAWQEIQGQLERLAQEVGLISQELTARLQQQEERVQNILRETKEAFADVRLVQESLQRTITTIQHDLFSHQEMVKAFVEQHRSELRQIKEAQDERFKAVEQRQEEEATQEQASQKAWQIAQKHIETQRRQLQQMRAMIQEENATRQTLYEQFSSQKDELLELRHELERLKTLYAKSDS